MDDIRRILKAGIEKVVLNTAAIENPQLVRQAADEFGSQAVVVSMDVKRKLLGRYEVFGRGGARATGLNPVEHAQKMEQAGAGEIFLTAIDRDGTMEGYDLDLISKVASQVRVPVIAAGGAGKMQHFTEALRQGADAVAAGAMFVFHGPHRAVLITYPPRRELEAALQR
jgi:cyclase